MGYSPHPPSAVRERSVTPYCPADHDRSTACAPVGTSTRRRWSRTRFVTSIATRTNGSSARSSTMVSTRCATIVVERRERSSSCNPMGRSSSRVQRIRPRHGPVSSTFTATVLAIVTGASCVGPKLYESPRSPSSTSFRASRICRPVLWSSILKPPSSVIRADTRPFVSPPSALRTVCSGSTTLSTPTAPIDIPSRGRPRRTLDEGGTRVVTCHLWSGAVAIF